MLKINQYLIVPALLLFFFKFFSGTKSSQKILSLMDCESFCNSYVDLQQDYHIKYIRQTNIELVNGNLWVYRSYLHFLGLSDISIFTFRQGSESLVNDFNISNDS